MGQLANNYFYFAILIICFSSSLMRTTHSLQTSDLFPHFESDGTTRFFFGDDGGILVRFSSVFQIFGSSYNTIWISGNGYIKLGTDTSRGGTCERTPQNAQTIMAFRSDADNNRDRDGAKLLYKESSETALLLKAKRDVIRGFPQLKREPNFDLTWMYIITWKNLPQHGRDALLSKRNTFQVILTKSATHSFILFYYTQIEWTSGRWWHVGFDLGNNQQLYYIQDAFPPGSCTSSFPNVTRASNIGIPGKFVFQVENNVVEPTPELTPERTRSSVGHYEKQVSFQPSKVTVMGNVPIIIKGLSLELETASNITCIFRDPSKSKPLETTGVIVEGLDETSLVCSVPYLHSLGKIEVNVIAQSDSQTFYEKGHIFVVKEDELGPLPEVKIEKIGDSQFLSASWNTDLVKMKDVMELENGNLTSNSTTPQVHFLSPQNIVEIVLLEFNKKSWREVGTMTPANGIYNNGLHMSPLNATALTDLNLKGSAKKFLRTFALKTKYVLKSGKILWKLVPTNVLLGTETIMLALQDKLSGSSLDSICDATPSPFHILDTLPCPRTLEQAEKDWRFAKEKNLHKPKQDTSTSLSSFLQKVPSPTGAGSQCVYDSEGKLIMNGPSAGRYSRQSPNNRKDYWSHYMIDFMPYLYCCKWSSTKDSSCPSYLQNLPSNIGERYVPPRPSRATGLTHLTTFDGLNHTLSGEGEFWLIKYSNHDHDDEVSIHQEKNHKYDYSNEFKMQVKLEPVTKSDKAATTTNASIITAASVENESNGVKSRVQVSQVEGHIQIMLDGEIVDGTEEGSEPKKYPKNLNIYLEGGEISLKSRNKLVATFSNGVSIMFLTSAKNDSKNMNIVASAGPELIRHSEGLLVTSNKNVNYTDWIVKKSESIFSQTSSKNQTSQTDFIFSDEEVEENNSDKPSLNITVSRLPEYDFCNGNKECNHDYFVTNNLSIAESGLATYKIYEDILKVAMTVEEHCDLPQNLRNGKVTVTSMLESSNLTVSCNQGYILHPPSIAIFICVEVVKEGNPNEKKLKWMNSISNEEMPTFVCVPEREDGTGAPVGAVGVVEGARGGGGLGGSHVTLVNVESNQDKFNEGGGGGGMSVGVEIFILILILVMIVGIVIGIFSDRYRVFRTIRIGFLNKFFPVRKDVDVVEL